MTDTIRAYEAFIVECEKLALQARTDEERAKLQQMARSWRELAEERRDWIRANKGREPIA